MNEYEITYISTPQLTDEARGELDGTIDAELDKLQASIQSTEPTTRRRLFYPIKKQAAGFLRALNVVLDPAHITPFRQWLTKQPGILRVTILQTAPRSEVTTAIFDELEKPSVPVKAKVADKKPAKEVTMQEVEERIEEALEEEVK